MLIPSPFGICFARHNGNAYWAILHASDSISMVASCHGCSLRLPQARCHRHAAACTVRCCYPWSLPRFLLVSGCTFVEAHCCFELSQMYCATRDTRGSLFDARSSGARFLFAPILKTGLPPWAPFGVFPRLFSFADEHMHKS